MNECCLYILLGMIFRRLIGKWSHDMKIPDHLDSYNICKICRNRLKKLGNRVFTIFYWKVPFSLHKNFQKLKFFYIRITSRFFAFPVALMKILAILNMHFLKIKAKKKNEKKTSILLYFPSTYADAHTYIHYSARL